MPSVRMPGGARRARAILLCATVLAAGAVPVSSAGAAPPGTVAASAPQIDLADPTATVADPVAGLVPVDAECRAGQVDLNTASPADLSEALNLPSQPTVQRLIALRPWLKGADLSSVPGIGPDTAAALAPRTCATPPALPPAAPLACATAGQVDLQAASAPTIASQLRLPRKVADALVAARPLPQNLTQVIAPRIPGLSKPTVERLLSADRICVTPAPMLAGGSAWRWATPAGGAVVRRDGFALIVPPGRITAPSGAYASVTPLPAVDGIAPRMDAHIWGDWALGATTVAVQGPWLGAGAGLVPVVLHDSTDRGLTMSTGGGAVVSTVDGAPTVTAQQYSLSESRFGAAECAATGSGSSVGGSVFCIDTLTDGQLADQWTGQARAYGSSLSAVVRQRPACQTVTGPLTVAASFAALPFGVSCGTTASDSTGRATWTFTNDAYGDVFVASLGVLYNYAVYGGSSDVELGTGAAFPLGTLQNALNGGDDRSGILFTQQSLLVTKARDSGETRVDVDVATGATAAWAGMLGVLDSGAGELFKAWHRISPAAATNALAGCTTLDARGVACVTAAAELAADALLANGSVDSKLRLLASTVKGALKVLPVATWVTNFTTAAVVDVGDGSGVLLRNNSIPVTGPGGPPGGGGQGPVVSGPIGFGDSFIARDPSSRRSVLVKPSGAVLNIASGGVFNCLARTWLVVDVAAQSALNQRPSGEATCGEVGGRAWDIRPAAEGGNVPVNVLLRERAEDQTNGVVESYLLNSRGELQPIPDGGTYLCLAHANPVVWNVADSAADAWQPRSAPASCG